MNSTYVVPSWNEATGGRDPLELAVEIGKNAEETFQATFSELQEEVLKVDPLESLASFSLKASLWINGVDPELAETKPILEWQVEFLQAIILRNGLGVYSDQPKSLDNIFSLLTELQDSSLNHNMNKLEKLPKDQLDHFFLSAEAQFWCQVVRQPYHHAHLELVIQELLEPLEERNVEVIGLKMAGLFRMYSKMWQISNERVKKTYSLFRDLYSCPSAEKMASLFSSRTGVDVAKALDRLDLIGGKERGPYECASVLIGLVVADIYKFEIDECLKLYGDGCEINAFKKVLRELSLEFGELKKANPMYFGLGNPVWVKPFIWLSDKCIFAASMKAFETFFFRMYENLISSNESLTKKYEKRRSDYLETAVEGIFKKAFPSANILANGKWKKEVNGREREYETDLLILVDRTLLIVESKSGYFSDSAQRGAPFGLRKAIHRLIVAPSIQSQRLQQRLAPNSVEIRDSAGVTLTVDSASIDQIIRLNITLENLGTLALDTRNESFHAAIPAGVDVVPTISLSDLLVIQDILKPPSQKINYLANRYHFQKNMKFDGDELDVLAFYLDHGFPSTKEDYILFIRGFSKALDQFYVLPMINRSAPAPIKRLSQKWQDTLRHIEGQMDPGWTLKGHALLDFTYSEQESVEKLIRKTRQRVIHSKAPGMYNKTFFQKSDCAGKDFFFAYICYKNGFASDEDSLIERMIEYAKVGFPDIQQILIFVDDLNRPRYPCTSIELIKT